MKSKKYSFPILVVDDEPAILEVMSANLKKRNYKVHVARTGAEALMLTSENDYAAVILDYNLPDINGFRVLAELKKGDKDLTVIMITAYGTIEMAVTAMKAGALNYLAKPINYDEMALVVDKAVEHHKLITELSNLRQQIDKDSETDFIIGQTRKMQKLFEKVKVVAESDATVFIRGETGTGKELIARAIHRYSPRRNQSFVRINCAAIPDTLLEAELFGYEKGSFTGALKQKPGKFELANRGTIYLDEIGDIAPVVQTKLLRVLQNGEFDRIGGTRIHFTDARVIATTNRDIEKAIEENKFRLDLFYRLNVIPLFIPPLRERKGDIPLLVSSFIIKYSEKNKKEIKEFSPAFISTLADYEWPGNVRELENLVERAVVLTQGKNLEEVEIPRFGDNGVGIPSTISGMSFQGAKKRVIESFEAKYLYNMLKKHNGNISASAKESGLDYKNFHCKLKKYHIKRQGFEK